jgi:hypothetical protein
MLRPDDAFWARLLDLTTKGPDMLGAVCQHLSRIDRKSLHSVSRAMRTAMNATVTSIHCSQLTLPTYQQLHEVFPNASSMALSVEGSNWDRYVSVWPGYLQRLVSSSQLLLSRLSHLSLTIRPVNMTKAAAIEAILKLLTRCGFGRRITCMCCETSIGTELPIVAMM